MFSKNIVTLNIESDSIRAVAVSGRKVIKWGSISLEPGLVRDGLILQPDVVSKAIDRLFSDLEITEKKVRLSITGLRSTFRILTLPVVKASLLEESVHRSAKREMPVSIDELYLSWQVLGTTNGEHSIFVLGMPQELVDSAVDTFAISGIKPPEMDFKPLTLARLVNRGNALIVDLERGSFGITLISKGMPVVIRTLTPKGSDSILEDHVAKLNSEITRIIDFYNKGSHSDRITPDIPVFLTGTLAHDQSTAEAIAAGINYMVEPLDTHFKYPPEFPMATYAANLGLASRGRTGSRTIGKSTDRFHDISPDVLPAKYRPQPVPFKYAFLGLIPVVLIGGLLPVYNIATHTGTHTVEMQSRLDDLTHTLQSINQAANSINNVENTISNFRAETANLREQSQSVSSVNEGFGDTTQLVVDALPAGTSLTSISIGADHISLAGGTSSPSRVIDYAKALENLGEFKSVFITNLSNSFNLEIER